MSNVKIYTAVSEDLSPLIQGEGFCVDMVRYSDYAALEAKCAALAAKINVINELMEAAEQVNKLAQEETEKLAHERNTLAAELSAVDKIHNEAVLITDDHYEQCPPEVQKMIRSLAVLQIPAYDAFLAEVLAQGVDMAACALDDVNQFNYANMLDDLAQKLRQDTNTEDLVAAGIGVKEQ